MKHNKTNAEKVATCFFLNGMVKKSILTLHQTKRQDLDSQIQDAVYDRRKPEPKLIDLFRGI